MSATAPVPVPLPSYEALDYREGYAGGCYINAEATCVAQPEDYCDEGTFVSAHYLRANSGHPLRYCNGELENVVIGRCGDSGKCSNLIDRCEDGSSFTAFDSTCTIILDLSTDKPTPVTYGKCGNRCVWSSENCLDGEEYIRNDPSCTADKVEIGACFAGHAYCAPSEKSCADKFTNEPYWDHQTVQTKVKADCFLSKLPAPPTPYKAPTPRVIVHGEGSVLVDINVSDIEVPVNYGTVGSSGNNGLDQTVLVIIVAISAVLAGIILGVSAVHCKRKDKDAWRVKEHSTTQDTSEDLQDLEMREKEVVLEVADSEISDM